MVGGGEGWSLMGFVSAVVDGVSLDWGWGSGLG